MLDFKQELYRLLEQEAQPLPEDGLAEIAGAGRQLLASWNKKQSELSMQVEEIYDIVAGMDTSALSDALDSERKRAGELVAAVVTLCDILEDFYAFARESGDAALSEQARMMWKSAGNTLERLGFARLGEEGQPLDPECKIALSERESYEISLPFLFTAMGGKPVSVEKTVSRSDFENLIREKVELTRAPMLSALSGAGMSPADLDLVLLVGGSTRVPLVRRMVADTLNVIPRPLVDPELAVARGAAIQAAIIDGSLSGDLGLVLTDVCPYTLGAAVLRRVFTRTKSSLTRSSRAIPPFRRIFPKFTSLRGIIRPQ